MHRVRLINVNGCGCGLIVITPNWYLIGCQIAEYKYVATSVPAAIKAIAVVCVAIDNLQEIKAFVEDLRLFKNRNSTYH